MKPAAQCSEQELIHRLNVYTKVNNHLAPDLFLAVANRLIEAAADRSELHRLRAQAQAWSVYVPDDVRCPPVPVVCPPKRGNE
jgi:hypothetical protein